MSSIKPTPDEIKAAADGGDPVAQFQCFEMLRNGAGVPRDLNAANRYLEASAKQKHPPALVEYVLLLNKQHEFITNRMLTEAARRGYARAQFLRGIKYEKRGLFKFAIKQYTDAAKRGHIGATFRLGVLLSKVPKYEALSVRLFKIASQRGDVTASAVVALVDRLCL